MFATLSMLMVPALIGQSATAADAVSIGAFSAMPGVTQLVPCGADGSAVASPTKGEGVNWTITVQRRDARHHVLWETAVPIPADQVLAVPAKNERQQKRLAYGGERDRSLAELMVDDACSVSLLYIDDDHLMRVGFDENGLATEPKKLTKAIDRTDTARPITLNESRTLAGILSDDKTGHLLDASGKLVRKVRLPRGYTGLRLFPSDNGELAAVSRYEKNDTVEVRASWFGTSTKARKKTTIQGLPLGGGELVGFHTEHGLAIAYKTPGEQDGEAVPFVWLAGLSSSDKEVSARASSVDYLASQIEATTGMRPFYEGTFKLMGIAPDGLGGLVLAGRSDGQKLTFALASDGGVEPRVKQMYGDVLVHRMAPDGSEAWSMTLGGATNNSAIYASYRDIALDVDEGGVHVAYRSNDYGMLNIGAVVQSTIQTSDGAVIATEQLRPVMPNFGDLDGDLSFRSSNDHWVLGLRTVPSKMFLRAWDHGAGVLLEIDDELKPPKRRVVAGGSGSEESAEFVAGRAFAEMDASFFAQYPFVHGYGLGAAVGATSGFITNPSSSEGLLTSYLITQAISTTTAVYTVRRGYGWWTSQSDEFRAGYRDGLPKGKQVKAGLGTLITTPLTYFVVALVTARPE